jgi:hypothetical protein
MKKTLLIVMATMLLFASCKKSTSEEVSDQKLHQVKFNVAVFNQSIGDFPTKQANVNSSHGKLMSADAATGGAKLSSYIQRLDYFLYNEQGIKIGNKTIYADTSETGFTLPKANLPAGTYTVIFVGSIGKQGRSGDLYIGGESLTSFYMTNSLYSETPDVFYDRKQFVVGSASDSVDVTLKRPGGKIKIVIADEWPANVDRIGLSINGVMNLYANGSIYQGIRNDISIYKNYTYTNGVIGGQPTMVETYLDCSWENFIFTDSSDVTTLNAVITAYGKSNEILVTKNVNNIRVERNKITTVSGKLFDNMGQSTTSSFLVKIDSDLSGEIHQSF